MSYLGKIKPKIKLGMASLIAECVMVNIARDANSNMMNIALLIIVLRYVCAMIYIALWLR